MEMRGIIETAFEGRLFDRPLFYAYPGGLRFELSEDGTSIHQFLLAIQKATTICSDLFRGSESFVICVRKKAEINPFAHRNLLRELKGAGIVIPRNRSLWLEPVPKDDWFDENKPEFWVTLAFEVPLQLLQNVLWCGIAADFGSIRPRPICSVYLINLSEGVAAFPYDDRGMDVVGNNHVFLANLYAKHQKYLLGYDIKKMEAVFGTL